MDYFPIPSFRPIETKEDASDQDRTVLRLCEGMAAYPQGALCAGPQWKLLWGLDDLGGDIETALSGADVEKAHFVIVSKNGHTFLVCWSLEHSKALGFFYVGGSDANQDLDSTGSVTITATANATFRDKDPDAEWFASPIAGRVLLGNGVDANLVWYSSALSVFGPSTEPTDPNSRARKRIPACTCFRQHVNRSIFAAGNAASPMRVWITDEPNLGEPFIDGVYSLATSFIDVHPHGGATRITCLSVFQQYVTAHTDKAPVNLYGVDNTSSGWKCEQSASAANSSAINPNCVGDTHGDAEFYLGRDLEVYFDQAIRSGPYEKRSGRKQEIATLQAAGSWNKTAKRPLLSSGYHVAYDRETRLFWMFIPNTFDDRPSLFVYNERTRTVAGPWRYPAAIVGTVMAGLGSSILAVITDEGHAMYADLAEIGELEPEEMEASGTALGSAFAIAGSAPTVTPGMSYCAMPADNSAVLEVGANGSVVGLADMWGALETLDPGDFTLTQFFKDAYLVRFECPWMDIGSAETFKNFLEVRMQVDRDARAYVGIYAETDSGRRGGRWKGLVHGKDSIRIPMNLFGHKVRVRVVAVCFNAGRCLVRSLQIGYAVGGRD